MLVIFTEMLLLSSALMAPSASQPSQLGNDAIRAINGSDSNLASYNGTSDNLAAGLAPGKVILYHPLGFITTGKPTYIWSKVKNTQFYNLLVLDSSDNTVINQ